MATRKVEDILKGMAERTACPACSSTESHEEKPGGVFTCDHCGGVFGGTEERPLSERTVRRFVKDEWADRPDFEAARYFDFVYLGRDGRVDRTHGWADRYTRKIVQTG